MRSYVEGMTKKRVDVPIACTLTAASAEHQLQEWKALQPLVSGVASIDGGVRMTLPGSLEMQVRDLVVRESACCAFLTISVHRDDQADTVTLEITSTNADAAPVIAMLTGTAAS